MLQKKMQDMDCTKVDMRSLVAKIYLAENHAPEEMQNIASEIQVKQFKELLASK